MPGDLVVITPGRRERIRALEQIAEVARLELELLVVARADSLAVADVAGPGVAVEGDVPLPGEGKGAARLPGEPRAVERVGNPGAEVAVVARGLIEGLDDGEVLARPLELVDVGGLEEAPRVRVLE